MREGLTLIEESILCPTCKAQIQLHSLIQEHIHKALKAQKEKHQQEIKDLQTRANSLLLAKQEEERKNHTLKAELEQLKNSTRQLEAQKEELKKECTKEFEIELKEKEHLLQQFHFKIKEIYLKSQWENNILKGEIQEILIQDWLQNIFPTDNIYEIKRGVRGADCIQEVYVKDLGICGKIYYESKRTKEFQKDWINKLQRDVIDIGADMGILVTTSTPKNIDKFGIIDGILVCNYEVFKPLSAILRNHLITLKNIKSTNSDKQQKTQQLYNYLTSYEFYLQIENILSNLKAMKESLEAEKRSTHKLWKMREKQMEQLMISTAQFHGSLKGILTNALPSINYLEFPETKE